MAADGSVKNEGLVRVIGTWALGLSVVNLVVGAGIFALPGRVAAELGSAAIVASWSARWCLPWSSFASPKSAAE